MAIKTVSNINILTVNKRFLKLLAASITATTQQIIDIVCIIFTFLSH